MKYWTIIFFILLSFSVFADDEHVNLYKCNNPTHLENILYLTADNFSSFEAVIIDHSNVHEVIEATGQVWCETTFVIILDNNEPIYDTMYWSVPLVEITFEETLHDLGQALDKLNNLIRQRFYQIQ